MGADYRKFKTPFYEISISDATGKRFVNLPHHILRLVDKIEITETFIGAECTAFTLDFIEGSREPASPDASLGTDGLYKIGVSGQNSDMAIAGSITNRSGSITDLRFSGTAGITWLTETERKNGAIDRRPQENINGDIVTRSFKNEPSRPQFLFQANNIIKVTWGYKEDIHSQRTIAGYITTLTSTFPDSGPTKTTVTCQDTKAAFDQIVPTKGIPFGTVVTTGKGNSIVTFKDEKTDKVLRSICDKLGMAAIISENLPGDVVDKDKQKLWIAGESFHQFMTRLARIHNSYYTLYFDPKTKKDTLAFIKKADFESVLVITDRELTTYKGPGSILKSVEIRAAFALPSGNGQMGINNNGKVQGAIIGKTSLPQFLNSSGKLEQVTSDNPANGINPIPSVAALEKNLANGSTTGTLDLNPSTSKDRQTSLAENETNDNSKNISLEFVSLGYPKYHPGVIEFRNLGVRYSGKYRLVSVTHTIDSSGYVTKGSAMSMAIATGGVQLNDTPKVKDPVHKSDVIQFEGEKSNNSRPEVMKKYHNSKGIR